MTNKKCSYLSFFLHEWFNYLLCMKIVWRFYDLLHFAGLNYPLDDSLQCFQTGNSDMKCNEILRLLPVLKMQCASLKFLFFLDSIRNLFISIFFLLLLFAKLYGFWRFAIIVFAFWLLFSYTFSLKLIIFRDR